MKASFIALCFAVLVAVAFASDEITHLPGFVSTDNKDHIDNY